MNKAKKKICSIIVASAIVMSCASSAFSAAIDEIDLIPISIEVNVTDGTVINGEEAVECEAPYVTESGVTMIDASVVVDAFEAEMTIEDGTAKIEYAGVTLTIVVGSNKAIIGEYEMEMPEAASLVNGKLMVPLRFFAESFGADVTYDSETKSISIDGSNEGVGTEADFKMILKYSNKSKVGNSKQKWCFDKPDDFDVSTGYYGTQFLIEDVYFTMGVTKNTNKENIDQLYVSMQENERYSPSYYFRPQGVVFEKKKGERAGIPYVSMKVRNTGEITEYHGFITDEYIYTFVFSVPFEDEAYQDALNNPTINSILDSFKTNYDGTDDDCVDLAKENIKDKEKKTEYKDGNFLWNINVADGWEVHEYYGFSNAVSLTRPSEIVDEKKSSTSSYDYYYDYDYYGLTSSSKQSVLNILSYSNPNGQSVTDWAREKQQYEKGYYNPEFCKVSDITDTKIGEINAKKFTTETTINKITTCKDYYFVYYMNYRYMLTLSYDKREAENPEFLKTAEAMINSFAPYDISYDLVGEILELDSYMVTDAVKKNYETDEYSLTLPYLWRTTKSGNSILISDDYSYISSGKYSAMITKAPLDKVDDEGEVTYYTLEELLKREMVTIKKAYPRGLTILTPITKTTFDGREAYKFEYSTEMAGSKLYISSIAVKDTDIDCYLVETVTSELYKGSRGELVLKDVINSIKFK